MISVVDCDQAARLAGAGPGEGHEAVRRFVTVPGGAALEQLPVAVAEGRVLQAFEESVVEAGDPAVDDLDRPTPEVDGDAHALPLALALVEEAEARREERDDGSGPVCLGREGGGGPWLVVVLEEAGQTVLEVQARREVPANRTDVALLEPVVEPLVVGVVEALLLKGPFEVPVDLGEKEEARDLGSDRVRDSRPEGGRGDSPRSLEDLRQDEHRHVAADAIALVGDPLELSEHRLLERGVAVVQLQCVGPAVEVRVAPVRQDARPLARLHATVVLRRCGELLLRAGHEEVRVIGDPGVVRRHVVRDEVEDKAKATTLKALAEAGERLVAAEVLVHPVVPDRETRAAHVFLTEVGQDATVLGEPLGIGLRDASRGVTRLPDAKEPDDVEPVGSQPIEFDVRDVVERGGSPRARPRVPRAGPAC